MSIPGAGNPLLLGGAGGYKIERSLRFNSADSAYLSRTPASAGNRKTWTFSFWCKRVAFPAGITYVLGAFPTASIEFLIGFNSSQQFYIEDFPGSTALNVTSAAAFRDPSAWYHFLISVDTTQATASNRIKLYVNEAQITAFATATYPTQNHDVNIWNTSQATAIGARGRTFANPANFYLADIHFIDGQALTPSSFGETDINGIWQPKAYSGTYGTNGFQLKFADNSNNTATTLGKDTSPNGNNWTPTNLSVTAGAGNDSLVDSPTNYGIDTGAGGEVRGNYCALNPIRVAAGLTISNGNLDVVHGAASASVDNAAVGTISVSNGKWYWEVLVTTLTAANIGIISANERLSVSYLGSTASSYSWLTTGATSQKWNNNVGVNYGTPYAVGVIIGVALDLDNGTLTYYRNGVSQGTAFTSINGTFAPASSGSESSTASLVYNFGQRPFAYTAPSGFKALCTQNLPAPTITKPSTVMDVALWTGNGSARSITGLGFNPDFVWIKGRSVATDHALYDAVRGAQARLESNTTDAEVTGDGGLTAFNSDGFSLGTMSLVNINAGTYVGWAWDAGSSTVTNNDGTISSQVRANASAGFSVVTAGYFSGTVGHGLGVAPAMVIAKQRNGASQWYVYHQNAIAAGTVANNSFLLLHTTSAVGNAGSNLWNVTSTTVGTNQSGTGSAVYYCFAPVAGYSSFGSYTGNGNADGPFVYLGFRPAVVLVKMSSSTGNWTMLDYQREGYNVDNDPLFPNLVTAEGTTDLVDITSNGFKVRTTDASFNTNAGTYIYAAWAQSPFSLARAR